MLSANFSGALLKPIAAKAFWPQSAPVLIHFKLESEFSFSPTKNPLEEKIHLICTQIKNQQILLQYRSKKFLLAEFAPIQFIEQ
jgi:hypothetical protein